MVTTLVFKVIRMTDTTGGIPQNGTTTATTPATPIPAAQDLQINLDEAPKVEEKILPENKESDLNLDLDLNLSDAPKDDDRLKAEDQKNIESEPQINEEPITEQPAGEPATETPVEQTVEIPIIEEIPEIETEEIYEPEPVMEETPIQQVEQVVETPVIEEIPEVPTEEIVESQPVIEEIPEVQTEEIIEPATTIEEEVIPPTAPAQLQDDMKMIEEMESHASAWGLAPDAVVNPQPAPVEPPKTFDLDAMLGASVTPPNIEATPQPQQTPAEIPMPQATATPVIAPAFTIPTTPTPTQTSTQSPQPFIPQKKNSSVKTLLFIMMFIALGFTTFFILKTMYPIEFSNMFGWSETQTESEISTWVTEELPWTGEEITGATDVGMIETGTGTHESATEDIFGELDGIWGTTEEKPQDNISRLTDYVTQGNDFLTEWKAVGNNTMIKYGLYISKKSTTFLEKIANGEEINNLSWYFAQFDKYITQLKELAGQTTGAAASEEISTTTPANEPQGMTEETTTSNNALQAE